MKKLFSLLWFALASTHLMAAGTDWGIIRKGSFYNQTGTNSPALLAENPYVGQLMVRTDVSGIGSVSVLFPNGALLDIPVANDRSGFEVSEAFASLAQLDTLLPSGPYLFQVTDARSGVPIFFSVTVPNQLANSMPVLKVANYAEAQQVDAASNFQIKFATSGTLTPADQVQLLVYDQQGGLVYQSGEFPGDAGSVSGDATSISLPANSIKPGITHTAWLAATRFFNVDSSSIPGVRLAGAAFTVTQFALKAAQTGGTAGGALTITTTELPFGNYAKPYNTTLVASGGRPPYRWSINSEGNPLTDGIKLNPETGQLSGTPGALDLALIQVRVTDADNKFTEQPYFLLVLPGNEPAILLDPFNQTAEEGEDLLLEVLAIGEEPLRYQWEFNGTPIPGANDPELFLLNSTPSFSGDFRVVIQNAFGSITSKVARVSILSPPQITQQPQSRSAAIGERVQFAVQAAGTVPYSYQWQLNGEEIPGATSPTLVIPSVQAIDSGDYSVVISGPQGAVTSADATLTVALPAIGFSDNFRDRITINSPQGSGRGSNLRATREAGEPLHAGLFGGTSVWLDWVAPGNGIATFTTRGSSFDTLLAAYTGTSLATLKEAASDEDSGAFFSSLIRFNVQGGIHYAIAMDGFFFSTGDVVLSWSFTQSDGRLPIIKSQPQDQILAEGRQARFSVIAANEPPETSTLKYQWFRNGQPIPGATAATLTIPSPGLFDLGIYQAEVSNSVGAVRTVYAFLEFGLVDGTLDDRVSTEDKFANAVLLGQQPAGAFQQQGEQGSADESGTAAARGYSGTQAFNSYGSTGEEGEPNHCGVIGGASQWFTYLAEQDGILTVGTDGSDFDTVVAVYTGSGTDFQSLKLAGCDNNGGPNGKTSLARVNVKRNTTYYIAVDGSGGTTGNVKLSYSLDAPPRLVSSKLDPNGFHFTVQSEVGKSLSLQASDDFVHWTTIKAVKADKATVDFDDPDALKKPSRFYRVFTGK